MSVRIIKGRKLTDREIAEVTTPPGQIFGDKNAATVYVDGYAYLESSTIWA
jgi:hypothetical protein